MAIKARIIDRSNSDCIRKHRDEINRYSRNPNPSIHPFERAREYTRALTATKLEKMFAKPFIGSLDGHHDSIKCLTKSHKFATVVASGSCDGDVRLWELSGRKCLKSLKAHDGFARGVCFSPDDRWLFSCGDDKTIKQWNIEIHKAVEEMEKEELESTGNLVHNNLSTRAVEAVIRPHNIFQASTMVTSIDGCWTKPLLASAGEAVDIWDYERSSPVQSFEWGCEALYSVRFNPSESSLIASTAADNSIGLYDIRGNSPIRKVILKLRSNALAWNPQQPLNFTVANEDCNLYTFDMRKLDRAIKLHKDFTGPVLDVNYAPTGTEFVAGSYDKTMRIFSSGNDGSRSRDVYHTKRMQTVLAVAYSGDSRYVLSGSADMCLRIWKAKASAPLGVRSLRERSSLEYRETLKQRFSHMPEIRRIQKHHHIPNLVKQTAEKRLTMTSAKQRKEQNRRKHAKPGAVPHESVLVKPIIKQLE